MIESPTVLQYILGVFVLAFALMVVLSKNPVVSAMSLMGTLFGTGALYFGLGFHFIGVVQILIYAGAISVLFVFVVMLLDLKPLPVRIPGSSTVWALSLIAGGLLFLGLAGAVLPGVAGEAVENPKAADAVVIALRFLSKYMLPFQVTGLLLLAAVMGAIVLGRPKVQARRGSN